VQFFQRQIGNRVVESGNACVVNHRIDAPIRTPNVVCQPKHAVWIANVAWAETGINAKTRQGRYRFLKPVQSRLGNHHRRAFGTKDLG
jgi:hypothetical protein